jgi:hypothetical protein
MRNQLRLFASRWFLACLALRTWRWMEYVPPTRLLTTGLHGVISKNIQSFYSYKRFSNCGKEVVMVPGNKTLQRRTKCFLQYPCFNTSRVNFILRLLFFVVPQLKRLVAGFPPRWRGFDPRTGDMGFVVNKEALWNIFSDYFCSPFQLLFQQLFQFINHPITDVTFSLYRYRR